MSAPPLVSIGLPVYNGARYLQGALHDLQQQTLGDFELIVTDNASTDATPEIVAEAARTDERVRYVRHPRNRGAIPNLNSAFALARGRFFVLAAHDDRHAPDFLEHLVSALQERPEAVLAYGTCALLDEADAIMPFDAEARVFVDQQGRIYPFDRGLERILPSGRLDRFCEVVRSRDINSPIHGVFRREALARALPMTPYGADRLALARVALEGPFCFIDRLLFGYRLHPESTFFLCHDEWMEREAGPDGSEIKRLSGVRTLSAYLRAVREAPLSMSDKAKAASAVMSRVVRPEVWWRFGLGEHAAAMPAAPVPKPNVTKWDSLMRSRVP